MKEINIAIKIPEVVYKLLKIIERKSSRALTLIGDRQIEWSFVISNMPAGPGKALDFGPGSGSFLGLIAAFRGYKVVAVDLEKINWPYFHPNLKFIQGDFLKIDFPLKSFDLIINCSSVEHVGLAGRYGIKENLPDGDLETMAKMRLLLKWKGKMLLTVPIGQDTVFLPFHRVYGKKRLPKLLEGYLIEKKEFWLKNDKNQWILAEEKEALNLIPDRNFYGLGCFVLVKEKE
jgi:SAM-dependent methyltransferase